MKQKKLMAPFSPKLVSSKYEFIYTYIEKAGNKFGMLYASAEMTDLAPVVVGGSEYSLRRFSSYYQISDKHHHNNGIK